MLTLSGIEAFLKALALELPLEQFVLIGSFIEDLLAPIPAPVVMTTAGSAALVQGYTFWGLLLLAFIGSLGKTGGSWILYLIADKGEDILMPRIGKFFHLSHEDVERIGSYFRGSWKDVLILTLLRAIPVVPSLAISLVSGVIKLPLRVYLPGTLIGDTFRLLFFLYVGYGGLASYEMIAAHVANAEVYAEIALAVFILAVLALLYWQRETGGLTRWLNRQLKK